MTLYCKALYIRYTVDSRYCEPPTYISILRTGFRFPLFYSNKSLINPFYVTNHQYSELSVLRTKFSLPKYLNKALNTTEIKLKF